MFAHSCFSTPRLQQSQYKAHNYENQNPTLASHSREFLGKAGNVLLFLRIVYVSRTSNKDFPTKNLFVALLSLLKFRVYNRSFYFDQFVALIRYKKICTPHRAPVDFRPDF